MFTLYLKSTDISICFASRELSSASESKGGIFVIWAASELGLSGQNFSAFPHQIIAKNVTGPEQSVESMFIRYQLKD